MTATSMPMIGYEMQMAENGSKRAPAKARTRGDTKTQHTAVLARRELVEWCQAHGLPVPEERGPQSNGR